MSLHAPRARARVAGAYGLSTHWRAGRRGARNPLRVRAVLCLVCLLPSCALVATRADDPAFKVRGPIPSRTQEPIKLTFLALRPRTAEVLREGERDLRVTTAYSSLFQNGDVGSQRVVFDGE